MYKLYINKSIKSCLKKICFESSFKKCEGLNVSDLHWKTVSQFWSSLLEGVVTKCNEPGEDRRVLKNT